MSNAFNDPTYAGLLKIYKTRKVPTFVKEAVVADEQELDKMSSDLFADPARRRYPLNTASNTWLSREYFKDASTSDYLPKEAEFIKNRIDKAAAFWQLDEAEENVDKANTSSLTHKVTVTHESKPVFSFEISHPRHYKEAAEQLQSSKSTMTYPMRRSMARGLLSTPEPLQTKLPVELEYYIEKAAGIGVTTPENINRAIYRRMSLLGNFGRFEHPHRVLVKLAKAVSKSATDIGLLHKTAELLDLIDRAFDLNRNYDRGLPAPEDELFACTAQVVNCADNLIELTNGSILNKADLLAKKDMIDEFFDKYLGDIPYEDSENMIIVIKSLPKPDADAFIKIFEEDKESPSDTTLGPENSNATKCN